MIKIENLSKKFGKTYVLSDVNLEFTPGMIYGLRGTNGSGKTMLLRCITGMLKPTSGRILIDEKELYKDMDFPENLGMLIENPAFIGNFTAYENLRILGSYMTKNPDEIIRKALDVVGLDPDDKKKYRKFSLGMKQKLGIAAAIMGEPDIIILDEPFNALDEKSLEKVHHEICRLKDERIIIVACHDKTELDSLADKIYIVREGRFFDE
ncbi:MAG: ATP-binding cassette domain-containing protein [Lachnospiraceae bacterium]|nr:ATP-binding cassette domain-containing protein [Lachnospiraceae bacterium]